MRGGFSRFFLRLGQRGGHRLLARDQLAQALVGRRKIALDHDVGRARQTAAVAVGIEGPGPDDLEREEPRVDGAQELLMIKLFAGRQRPWIYRRHALAKSPYRSDRSPSRPAANSPRADRCACGCPGRLPTSETFGTCPRDTRVRPHRTPPLRTPLRERHARAMANHTHLSRRRMREARRRAFGG